MSLLLHSIRREWDKITPKFGLDLTKDMTQLDTFAVLLLSLPPSFHRQVMRNSVQWLDVYQETDEKQLEYDLWIRFVLTYPNCFHLSGMDLFAVYSKVVLLTNTTRLAVGERQIYNIFCGTFSIYPLFSKATKSSIATLNSSH